MSATLWEVPSCPHSTTLVVVVVVAVIAPVVVVVVAVAAVAAAAVVVVVVVVVVVDAPENATDKTQPAKTGPKLQSDSSIDCTLRWSHKSPGAKTPLCQSASSCSPENFVSGVRGDGAVWEMELSRKCGNTNTQQAGNGTLKLREWTSSSVVFGGGRIHPTNMSRTLFSRARLKWSIPSNVRNCAHTTMKGTRGTRSLN